MDTSIFQALTLTTETIEGRKYKALMTNYGVILKLKEVNELLNQIRDFYLIENIDDKLIDINTINAYGYNLSIIYRDCTPISELFTPEGILKFPKVKSEYAIFKTDKRHWSFKCSGCGEKISSKDQKGYYKLQEYAFDIDFTKVCSNACAEKVWNEQVNKWIIKEGAIKYFEQLDV